MPSKRLSIRILIYLFFISLLGYPLLFMGVISNSLFSYLGSIRRIRQMLSYEVTFISSFLFVILSLKTLNFSFFYNSFYLKLPTLLFLVLFISALAEINRAPFDFSEGESELVSGFNTEYYRYNFSIIFLVEYGIILLFRIIYSIIFINFVIIIFIILIII